MILWESNVVGDQNQTILTQAFLLFFQVFMFFISYPTRIFKPFLMFKALSDLILLSIVVLRARQNEDNVLIYLK